MTWVWIISIAATIIGIIILCWSFSENEDAAGMAIGGFLFFMIGSFVICGMLGLLDGEPKPSALDVYRGKTTLEITYKDSVAIDTTVVFKDEFKIK